ncbi:4-hydroxybenzoate 3-monooxygenase [Jannaschia aquimarina]|uniref:PobA protein n=1 Tax=Jannaschia aquimarina TaxID=935700 RepID=A0A0D1D5G8_9RHOB|nr:4-hydroxybenzoate 3-monooxygenase [Jannaschia aquimarina]KIT15218.1 p-hydroxybenzoate hydroxylase [Jannaschia aquimarina]SNT32758.1 p-hydroxybenzoate 3-monooxygenase [Jannaschia aquimarina]
MRTQVAIIGGGPAGLLLGQLLHRQGIDTILLEKRSKAHVLSRIRAGLLERGTCDLLHEAGVGARLAAEGFRHQGVNVSWGEEMFRIDLAGLTGHAVTVYGQTEVTQDLYDAREATDAPSFFEVDEVTIHDADTDAPRVTFTHDDAPQEIACDFVAGCDGFHGVSRPTIPDDVRRDYEKVYPFGWLGILSETPPVEEELIYASGPHGFALCSMRNEGLSRYYVQCDASESPDAWSDDAFWAELRRRLPPAQADALVTGPSIEKSIAPLRSYVCEPMRWGRLFLCGDAAHIVPPTGAKGLNTAAGDVHYLAEGVTAHYRGDDGPLDAYSERALARVWKNERFSWWFTSLMHLFPHHSDFERNMQRAEVALLRESEAAQRAMAENYVGLPL